MSVQSSIRNLLEKTGTNVSKDTSASSKVAVKGDATNPRQGDSQDANFEDLGVDTQGQAAANKMKKDTSKASKAGIKGDTTPVKEDIDEFEDDVLQDEEDQIDEETLDELSKKTLGSYVKKAGGHKERLASMDKSLQSAATAVNSATYDKGLKIARAGDDLRRDMEQERIKVQDKHDKRGLGIHRAVKKLTKENAELLGLELDEEELDELSKKTLGSYINKAKTDLGNKAHDLGKKRAEADEIDRITNRHMDNKYDNQERIKQMVNADNKSINKIHQRVMRRDVGIDTAVKKLTKEDLEAIFGTDLTEEHQNKASEIFEAAVIARVNEEMIAIEEDFEEQYNEVLAEEVDTLVEKVDTYLNYIVEQWMEDNQLAIEQGLKLEVMENFMSKLKDLFLESHINVPEDSLDVVAEMQEEVDSLKDRLNEEIKKNMNFELEIKESIRQSIFDEVAEGLADTEVEKFEKLVEGIEFTSEELYEKKLTMIKNKHFNQVNESVNSDSLLEMDTGSSVTLNNDNVSRYAQAISRSVKSKK